MNRQQRAAIAQETMNLLHAGLYQTPSGREVNIQEALHAACATTVLYLPDDYNRLVAELAPNTATASITITVTNRTTLAAARDLLAAGPVACLNFAAAKIPVAASTLGDTQEESLTRSTGLTLALATKPAFYEAHRQHGSAFYSDRVIFSPQVPVFRDDAEQLLAEPWHISILTAAAVNASGVRRTERRRVREIPTVMMQRMRMVLAVAASHRCSQLILGAWGCGIFGNEPRMIAECFAKVLAEPLFRHRFARIDFAVYDRSPTQATFRAFAAVFGMR